MGEQAHNMAIKLSLLLLAGVVATAHAACRDQPDCSSCLKTPFCGWCSPADTVFSNGTDTGAQCQDQHEAGWHCNHLYSTDKCLPGYTCDADKGQCVQAPEGKGDTKANCEKSCHKKPTGLSKCDVKNSQCLPCTDYCNNDSQCPGSYCQGGLCHGSTCQQNSTCADTCSADTPDILLGVWRGIQIQKDFGEGEYDMKFQSKKDGPQIMFRAAAGAISSGNVMSDAASGGRDLTLEFTAGPLKGSTLKGGYDAWEPSPETEQMAFFFGSPNDDKPSDIHRAMNGTGSTVYVLSRCGHGAVNCDFSSVFGEPMVFSSVDLIHDPCNPHGDCSSCIGDASKLCGWCSEKVVYSDGTPGAQCAGFDKTGTPLGWQCSGVFSKDSCQDYGCDWTDIKNPKCMPGKGSQTKEDCATACKPPEAMFTCDAGSKTCKACDMKYCTSDKQCPGSYCNIHGAGPWSCHDAPAGCMDQAACNGLKAHNCSTVEEMALCDSYAGQCRTVPHGTPNATTKYECEHNCVAAKPTGTYRGVSINAKFVRGEYDFTFYDDNTMHWRDPEGQVSVAALTGGAEVVEPGAMAIDGTVTKSDDKTMVGKKIYAIWKKDAQGNDDVAKFLFHGFDFAPVPTFAAGMSKTEWIMVACKDDPACDFKKAQVN